MRWRLYNSFYTISISYFIKQSTLWGQTISTLFIVQFIQKLQYFTHSSSCLLIVSFNTCRHCVMNDKTYIGFINSKSKGNSGANYSYFIFHPSLLYFTSFSCFQVRMIVSCIDIVLLWEISRKFQKFRSYS